MLVLKNILNTKLSLEEITEHLSLYGSIFPCLKTLFQVASHSLYVLSRVKDLSQQ